MDDDIGFVDYLIDEISIEQLATLYYQALFTIKKAEVGDFSIEDVHNANVDLLASVIEITDTKTH